MIPTIWDKKNITDCDVVELVETDLTNAWYFGLVSESRTPSLTMRFIPL